MFFFISQEIDVLLASFRVFGLQKLKISHIKTLNVNITGVSSRREAQVRLKT